MKLPNWVKILPEEKLQNWYLVFSEIKPDLKQAWDVADQHWLLQLQTLLLLWQTASLTNFTIIEIPNVVELDTSECNSAKPWNGMTCFKFQLNHTSLCRASSLSFNSFSCFWKDFCHSSICTWPRPFQLWEPWLDKVLRSKETNNLLCQACFQELLRTVSQHKWCVIFVFLARDFKGKVFHCFSGQGTRHILQVPITRNQ